MTITTYGIDAARKIGPGPNDNLDNVQLTPSAVESRGFNDALGPA